MNWPLKIAIHLVQIITISVLVFVLVKQKIRKPYITFAVSWLCVLLFDLSMVIIGLINPVNNHGLYNIAFALQIFFVIWFFARLLHKPKFLLFSIVFGAISLINFFFLQGNSTLNTYTLAIGGIIIIFLAILRMHQLYLQETTNSLFAEPDFWYSTGFILYAGLATPYFAMYNFLWEHYTGFTTIYFFTFNYGFATILNLSIIKALLCQAIPRK